MYSVGGKRSDYSARRRSRFCRHVREVKGQKSINLLNQFSLFVTFNRVYLVPDESDAMQTKIFKSSRHPSYQEMFGFFITKQNIKRSLWFHLYHTNAQCTTLIGNLIIAKVFSKPLNNPVNFAPGETEMKLTADFRKPITTWLQLSDSRNNCTNFGDMMFSLSYLPTAER